MSKQYIKLPKLNSQTVRKKYYVSQVFAGHPAKADIPMMIWILKKFCKDGDIVLDPMAGIGTTMVEGMRLFPNSTFVGVELEEKFVRMANKSVVKTEEVIVENWFMEMGKAVCLQGDAKELEKLLKEKVNRIISSPPYGGQVAHKTNYLGKEKRESGFEYSEDPENIGNLPQGNIDKIISSPPYSGVMDTQRHTDSGICGRDPKMVKMRYVDKIVTSPPYSQIRMDGGGKDRAGMRPYTDEPANTWQTQRDQKNIGNLKHGNIDKIITSPPFGQAQSGGGIAKKGYTGPKHTPHDIGSRSYMPENTGENKNNISNLPYVSKIITSPPYEETMGKKHHSPRADKLAQEKSNPVTYTDRVSKIVTSPPYSKDVEPHTEMRPGAEEEKARGYSENQDNIGNTKGKTYLEAMFLVYQQCFKVLKPDGFMILITKDFIRNYKRVHLGKIP